MKDISSHINGLGLGSFQPSVEQIGTRTRLGSSKPIIGQLITLNELNRDHLFTSLNIDKELFLDKMKDLVKIQTNTYKVLEKLAYKYLTLKNPKVMLQLGEENFGCQFICKWNKDKKIVTISRNCNNSRLFKKFSFSSATNKLNIPSIYNPSDEVYEWEDDIVPEVIYKYPLVKTEVGNSFKGDSTILVKQFNGSDSFAKAIEANEKIAKTFYLMGIYYSNEEYPDVKIICPIDEDLEFNFKFYGKRANVEKLRNTDLREIRYEDAFLSHTISYCKEGCYTEIAKMMEDLTTHYTQMLLGRPDEDKEYDFPIKIKLEDGSTSYIHNVKQLLETVNSKIIITNFS